MKKPDEVHPKNGININQLINLICSNESMTSLVNTFATCTPELTAEFFDPLMERERLEAHDYCASADVRHLRKFDNVYLIDFLKLPLKSTKNYQTALDVVCSSKLKEYCSQFVVIFPGDYPSQFHPRKIIFDLLKQYLTQPVNNAPISPLLSIIPMIGPLHIDLNSDEDLVLNFIPLLKQIYEAVFKGKKLADHPKPWRIQFILDIVYGGWTLIRRTVKTIFRRCKNIQYGTLLNFLDNYCPLILASYTILFKTNNFKAYFSSIIRIWIMMYSFRRHHYNKVLLIWLSFVKFWESNDFTQDIFNTFANHLNIIDESTVEYVHSVIRRHTTDSATDEQLKETIKAVFGTSMRQHNFREVFTPPKNYVFSRVKLKYLHSQVAHVLVDIFASIANNPDETIHLPRKKGQRKDCEKYIMPSLFGETVVKSYFLPLGFQCDQKPDVQRRCDAFNCALTVEEPWQIFEGCWHSFHNECLAGCQHCSICQDHLKNVVKNLSTSANATLLEGLDDNDESPEANTNSAGDDDDDDTIDDIEVIPETNYEAVVSHLNEQVIKLSPQLPSKTEIVQEAPVSIKIRKPPHCSKCYHIRLGHSKKNSTQTKCPQCPDQLCSDMPPLIPCTCAWHVSNSTTNL
jgi:hypothetical protein